MIGRACLRPEILKVLSLHAFQIPSSLEITKTSQKWAWKNLGFIPSWGSPYTKEKILWFSKRSLKLFSLFTSPSFFREWGFGEWLALYGYNVVNQTASMTDRIERERQISLGSAQFIGQSKDQRLQRTQCGFFTWSGSTSSRKPLGRLHCISSGFDQVGRVDPSLSVCTGSGILFNN